MAAIIGIDADILFVANDTISAITKGGIATASVAAGGASYAISDTISVTGGAAVDYFAILTVTDVSTGAVSEFTITHPGSGYQTSDTAIATTKITGSGDDNFTIDVDTINPLCLPIWSTNDTEWTVLVDDSSYSWVQFPERNEFSISISVDIAEHKVFVEDPSDAWVGKARLYMDWSGSMSGYLDTSNDTIFTSMKAGDDLWVMFVNSKTSDAPNDDETPAQYWLGQVILGSIDMSTPNEDYVTLDVDFAGSGQLYRSEMPYGSGAQA